MICGNPLVMVSSEGSERRLLEISEGDYIFDPWEDCLVQILRKCTRKISSRDPTYVSKIRPIEFSRNKLAHETPREPLHVSPKQLVCNAINRDQNSAHSDLVPAVAYASSNQTLLDIWSFTVIVPERSTIAKVNGVLLMLLGGPDLSISSDFSQPPA